MTLDEQVKMIYDFKKGVDIEMKDGEEWVDLDKDHQFDFVHNEYRYRELVPWNEEPVLELAIKRWHDTVFTDPKTKLSVGEELAFKAGILWYETQEEINTEETPDDTEGSDETNPDNTEESVNP